jgi:hypothetical protein
MTIAQSAPSNLYAIVQRGTLFALIPLHYSLPCGNSPPMNCNARRFSVTVCLAKAHFVEKVGSVQIAYLQWFALHEICSSVNL